MINLVGYKEMLINEEEAKRKTSQYSLDKLLIKSIQEKAPEVAEVLLELGANPRSHANIIQKTGYTGNDEAIHMAAGLGQIEIVVSLLNRGVDVDVPGASGNTPLLYSNSSDVSKELIKRGANVNARERKYGQTVLIRACVNATTNEGKDFVKELLSLGSDATKNAKDGTTPLIAACSAHVPNYYNSFYKAYLEESRSNLKNISHIEPLVKAGCDVNAENSIGFNALAASLWVDSYRYDDYINEHGELDELLILPRKLIELGANLNFSNPRVQGLVKHMLVARKRPQSLRLLIENNIITLENLLQIGMTPDKILDLYGGDVSWWQEGGEKLSRISKTRGLFKR